MNDKDMLGIITGGNYTDNRVKHTCFRDFNLSPIKRLYILENPDLSVVWARQGHQCENKWFYLFKGSFKLVLV